jgi:hypothetical protein
MGRAYGRKLIRALAAASLHVSAPLPIICDGLDGLVAYKGMIFPRMSGGTFTSYDDLISEITAGKVSPQVWSKQHGTIAGVANSWATMWPLTGMPPAGAYGGTALNAQALTDASTGAMLHGGNVSTDTKHLVLMSGMTTAATGIPGILMLYDRCLYYPGINAAITSAQTLVNGTGLPRYTTGALVMMWMEVTTALGTGTGVVTCAYTDQGNTAGNAFGAVVNTVASAIVGRLPHAGTLVNNQHAPFLALAAGDTGVRSVQTITFTTAHIAGVVALVMGVPLAMIPLTTVNVLSERDTVLQIAALPRVFDGACLSFLYMHSGALAASSPYMGEARFAWG